MSSYDGISHGRLLPELAQRLTTKKNTVSITSKAMILACLEIAIAFDC